MYIYIYICIYIYIYRAFFKVSEFTRLWQLEGLADALATI